MVSLLFNHFNEKVGVGQFNLGASVIVLGVRSG